MYDCDHVHYNSKSRNRPPVACSTCFGRLNPTDAWCRSWRWRASRKVLGTQTWPKTNWLPQWPPYWTMPSWTWGHTVCRTNGWGTFSPKAVINKHNAHARPLSGKAVNAVNHRITLLRRWRPCLPVWRMVNWHQLRPMIWRGLSSAL